jgi:SAM-dependent methyltransferase
MESVRSLKQLFENLRDAGYEWQPQTPDGLLAFRKEPEPFRPLVQWLGLGLSVRDEELLSDGLKPEVLHDLKADGFARGDGKAEMSVSGSGDLFIVHDHWPPDLSREDGYVHCAAESLILARILNEDLEGFVGKRVLDLGCSSGVLAFEVAGVADEVLGLDISTRSIKWARSVAEAYGFKNTRFEVASIGDSAGVADAFAASDSAGGVSWDKAIMNPPMIIPSPDADYPHRDGGKLGIELPLKFLEFASRHLRVGGELLGLVTNPIIQGRSAFFDRINMKAWEFVEKRCLHSKFNQAVARKQRYAEQGIERIELWFLHLKKRANS